MKLRSAAAAPHSSAKARAAPISSLAIARIVFHGHIRPVRYTKVPKRQTHEMSQNQATQRTTRPDPGTATPLNRSRYLERDPEKWRSGIRIRSRSSEEP